MKIFEKLINQKENAQNIYKQLGISTDEETCEGFEGEYTYNGVDYYIKGDFTVTFERDQGGELDGEVMGVTLEVNILDLTSGEDSTQETSAELISNLQNRLINKA